LKDEKLLIEILVIIASKELSILSQNISECCLGKRKSAGGYVWKFLELKTNK
jgi:hypothetical protein